MRTLGDKVVLNTKIVSITSKRVYWWVIFVAFYTKGSGGKFVVAVGEFNELYGVSQGWGLVVAGATEHAHDGHVLHE